MASKLLAHLRRKVSHQSKPRSVVADEPKANNVGNEFFSKYKDLASPSPEPATPQVKLEPLPLEEIPTKDTPAKFACLLDKDEAQKNAAMKDVALFVVNHIGANDKNAPPAVLRDYIIKTFHIDEAQFQKLLPEKGKAPAPRQTRLGLEVVLVSAEGLMGKDVSGKSDPYVTLELAPTGKASVLEHRALHSLPKESVGHVQVSRVVAQELNPSWNQTFIFELPMGAPMSLHLDVWDSDENQTTSSVLHGVGSSSRSTLGRAMREIKQHIVSSEDDDFLGAAVIDLADLPASGIKRTLPLQGRSKRSHVSGAVTVRLKLASLTDTLDTAAADPAASRAAHPSPAPAAAAAAAAPAPAPGSSGTHASLAALMQYQSLYELFVREDATVYFADHADAVEWDGKLGPASKDLLYQFAISNNITDAQQKAVRFAVLAQFYTKCGLDLPILAAAVKDLTAVQASAGTALQPLQPLIASSGQALITDIYRTLDRLHTSLGVNEEGASDFAEIAIIISGLVKLHVAANDIVNENVRICFENAFVSNFSRAMQASQPTKDYAGRDVVQSIKLVRALTQDVKQAALLFQPTAAKFEWDVTQSAVVVYDRNLQKFIEPIVAKYSKIEGEISPTLFELYYSLRAWEPEARSACPVFTSKIDVCELFFPIVRAWIEFSSRSSHAWVEKAVQLDTFTPVTDDSLISSSVIDVFRVVSDTWEFCVGLKWPVTNESAYIIAQHACITVCSCVGEYVRILIADLKAKGYHDADGQFDIAPSLCIVLNNLYDSHVRMKALEASVMDYLTETANGRSLKDAGNSEYFNEVCSTVNTELLRVTRAIAAKMRNDFAAWALKQVYNDAPAPTTKAEREAFLKPLLDYLDGNLSVLGQSCHADVFALLLEALWNVLMTGMGFVIAPSDPKMRLMTAAQHARAKALVEEMYNFFHDNGDGLAREKLETEQYAYVQELLGYSSPIVDNMTLLISKLLAEHYDSSRTSQQRGRIEYEIAHDRAAGTLSVKIVKCTNLVAMDDNGLSDPFVQVSILSPTAKPSMKKTSTKKKNLNPEFNETLVLPLTTPLDQSAVRLDVFDWDLATKNDHIGEVWVYLGACGGRVHETRFLQGSTVQHQRARDYLRLLELHKVAGNKIARSFLKSIDVVAGKEEAGAD